MAFPTVASKSKGIQASNVTTHTITLPTGSVAGNLLIVEFSNDGSASGTVTTPASGWTPFYSQVGLSDSSRQTGFYRIADGSEGATIVVTTSASEQSSWFAQNITNWHGTTPPEATTFTPGSSTSNPDPPNLEPSWGSAENLWIAVASWDNNLARTPVSYPTDYNDNQESNDAGTGNASSMIATRNLEAASEDPGTFAISGNEQWIGTTIAVRPAAGGGGGTTYEVSLSVSRKGSVSDLANLDAQADTSFGRGLGVSDGMTNSIGQQVEIDRVTGFNNSTGVGAFSVIDLQRMVAFLSSATASIEASIPLLKDLGVDPSSVGNLNASSAFHKILGVNVNGGLNILLETSISNALGIALSGAFNILGEVSVGKSVGFLPANIATIGGSVDVGKSLGLIDVPNLDAVESLSVSKSLSISDSASLTINAAINLSEKFVVIFDETVGAAAIVLILQTLSESLGMGTSAQLDSRPQVGLEVHEGMDGNSTAILNTDMGLGVEYSIVTVGDLNVIIIKGFVTTSDAAKSSASASSALKSSSSSSDSAKNSAETNDS